MICDIHNHIGKHMTAEQVVDYFSKIKEANGVMRNCILSIPVLPSAKYYHTQNLLALQVKDMMWPYTSSFMGFVHGEGAEEYLTQLKKGLDMGFEGLKILESHPSLYKKLNFRISDEQFDAAFGFAEENGVPVLMHVADPEESWDITKVDEYALTHGRFYGDEGCLSKEDYYSDVDKILQKHPNLRLILAHFYFMSADIDRAEALFEKYPNIAFDLTPGKEMYENFGLDVEKTRKFFIKYADRLYYGTDVNDTDMINYHSKLYDLVSTALSSAEGFAWSNRNCAGLGLPEDVRDKICSGNFLKLLGQTPKPLDIAKIKKEIVRLEAQKELLSEDDLQALESIKTYFNNK